MSGYQNWRTPAWLAAYINGRFGARVDVTSLEYTAPGMWPNSVDGLGDAPWPDHAFANPPWSSMDAWADKAVGQHGRWVIIGPASVSAEWFGMLAAVSTVYLPDLRIAYVDDTGRERPDRDSVIFVKSVLGEGSPGGIHRLRLRDVRNAARRVAA